jgi:hypothetical protein
MLYRIALRLCRQFRVESPNHSLDVDACQLIEFLQAICVRLLHDKKYIPYITDSICHCEEP